MPADRRRRRGNLVRGGALVAVGLLSSLGACGDEGGGPPTGARPRAAEGQVAGTCRLVGTPRPVRLRAWAAMGTEAGQDDESVDAGDAGALGGCVVTMEPLSPPPAASAGAPVESSFTLTALPGRFSPHVGIARAPVQLILESRLAEVIALRGRRSGEVVFNLAVDPGQTIRDAAGLFLDRPGVYRVTDDVRAQFTSWLHVVAGPHAALTRSEAHGALPAGGYRFERVPPGRHVLRCWHEPMDRRERRSPDGAFTGYVLGPPIEVTRTVEVVAGREARVDFEVPAGAERADAGDR